jgi:hypothetical protein
LAIPPHKFRRDLLYADIIVYLEARHGSAALHHFDAACKASVRENGEFLQDLIDQWKGHPQKTGQQIQEESHP